jgi:hypothetical protein
VEQALARGPLRPEELRLLRGLGRMQFHVPLWSAEQVLLRRDERVLARGPVTGKERGQERAPYLGPERRSLLAPLRYLLRVRERRLHKGLQLPLWSGGWWSADRRSQK